MAGNIDMYYRDHTGKAELPGILGKDHTGGV